MTAQMWQMGLDVAVMILLAAMLFFAIRLQKQLSEFRAGKSDFEKLVHDLAASVTQAEKAIQGLRDTARASGRDLQAQIDAARALSDEMQIITEAGDNLAGRLERATGNAGAPVSRSGGFAIRDPEAEGEAVGTGEGGELHSRAEKELFEALQGGRKGRKS